MRPFCMANHSKPVVAAFDFDGTLTYRDSLLPFLHSIAGTKVTLINLFLEIPHLLQYFIGFKDRQGLKEAFLTRFLKNKKREELERHAKQFAQQQLSKMIRPEGLERLAWHRKEGHRCILISANLDLYLKPWAELNGFETAITSNVEFSSEGKLTGHLTGFNCRGPEKVRRLAELLGPRESYFLYAYGDSEGDRELLEFSDKPYYRRFFDS